MAGVTAREEIAAAASTVDGITCTPYYAGADGTGAAYVELLRDEFDNRYAGVTFWAVRVNVPDDTTQAQQWYETHRKPLTEALWDARALVVTGTHPEIQLPTDGPATKVMVVEGHRATDEEI